MRLVQLVHQKDSLDRHNADAFTGHYARMRTQSTFRELNQLDTARRGDLSTLFESDKMWTWKSYEDIRSALDKAASECERMSGDVLTYNHDVYQSTY